MAIVDINEYEQVNLSYNYNGNIATVSFSIDPLVTITAIPNTPVSHIYSYYSNQLTVTVLNLTVTITGPLNDVFDRSIDYLDSNDILLNTTGFSNLPLAYHAVTKYVAPDEQIKSEFLNVTFDPISLLESVTEEIKIHYSWQVSNAALVSTVAQGAF